MTRPTLRTKTSTRRRPRLVRAEIVCVFRFEAAHFLPNVPRGHMCGRLHGHGYTVDVHVAGHIGEAGWVADFSAVETAFRSVTKALDHRVLNDVDGLSNPTAERVAVWIWDRLRPALPGLAQVVVNETADCRAIFRGR